MPRAGASKRRPTAAAAAEECGTSHGSPTPSTMDAVLRLQGVFLRCAAFVYLCAFASLYHQIPGLYGDGGILPLAHHLRCDGRTAWDCRLIGDTPAVLHLLDKALPSLGAAACLELAVIGGVSLAALAVVFACMRDVTVFAVMWAVYMGCVQHLGTFLWFQWDTLLLELGFLAIVVAPCRPLRRLFAVPSLPSDRVSLWLVVWLAFRLMFASGAVKLTSECPTWWGLTALHWHFESQCIPNGLAWYAHVYAPDWLKSLSVALTYLIEMPVVLWFLSPVRHIRVVAFWAQALLMLMIMATGNYNFFNMAYQLACLPLLADDSSYTFSPTKLLRKWLGERRFWLARLAFIGSVYGSTIYWFVRLFGVRLQFDRDLAQTKILTDVAFTKPQFRRAMEWWVPKLMFCATVAFLGQVLLAYIRCWTEYERRKQTLFALVGTSVNCFVCMILFSVSMVPFSTLVPKGAERLVPPAVRDVYAQTEHLQLTHSYGLFRRMTGVGGRPEVTLEGSDDYDGPWTEYHFKYKPTDLDRPPPFLIPHQARLDWQMWFAALGEYRQNPWFLSLLHRLLVNQTEVLELMEAGPFKERPPQWVRAVRYKYHFAEPGDQGGGGQWWRREAAEVYCPPFSLEHDDVLAYMSQANLLPFEGSPRNAEHWVEPWLQLVVTRARALARQMDPAVFVWSVCAAALVACVLNGKLLG